VSEEPVHATNPTVHSGRSSAGTDAIWGQVSASAEWQVIAGVELRAPDRDMLLLHVVLHAAHHANQVDGQPLEDRRSAFGRA
jgi:hypothetical protein